MSWYRDKVKDNIDVNQAVRDAGKIGEAVSYLGQTAKGIGDTAYNKKRKKIEDAQKETVERNKRYTADKGYAGKVDSANITAKAKNKATAMTKVVAGIKFNTEKYKTDGAYKKEIDGKILANKGKTIDAGAKIASSKISAGATLGAAGIRASASRYTADKGIDKENIASKSRESVASTNKSAKVYTADKGIDKQKIASETSSVNNYRSTQTTDQVSKRSAKTQLAVANINAKTAKVKAKKKTKAKLNMDSDYTALRRQSRKDLE